jgi:hypothetical protein
MNLFEIASRKKYRFPTRKGNASVEDLWGLSLESLNQIGLSLDETLNTKNYIGKELKDKQDYENKFDIVQHIIKVKLLESAGEKPKDEERPTFEFL